MSTSFASTLAQSLLGKKLSRGEDDEDSEEVEEEEYEEEEESDDVEADLEDTIETALRELKVGGDKVVARADDPHDVDGPRVTNRKLKNKDDKQSAIESLGPLDDTKLPEGTEEYVLPGIELLTPGDDVSYDEQEVEVRRKAKILEQTFAHFGLNVRVVEIDTGLLSRSMKSISNPDCGSARSRASRMTWPSPSASQASVSWLRFRVRIPLGSKSPMKRVRWYGSVKSSRNRRAT